MPLNLFNKQKIIKKEEVKGYIIGVSSGMFGMASAEEKISLIDPSQKMFYSGLKGISFTQIDLERGTEFISPDLANRIKKIKEDLGIDVGIHGLCGAMGSKGIFLDAAIEDDYRRTHDALIRDLEKSGSVVGAKYYLQHASETTPYGWLGKELQPTTIVDIWGRRFYKFLEENLSLVDWAVTQDEICETIVGRRREDYIAMNMPSAIEMAERELQYKLKKPIIQFTEEEMEQVKKRAREIIIESLKDKIISFSQSSQLSYGSERIAYYITAKWMADNNDPIWVGVVGNKKFEEVSKDYRKWVPAVSLKYIWGHFNPDKCKDNSVLKFCSDPKPILEKYNLDFVIETAMVGAGIEEEYRLTNPKHFVILCKYAGTKHFKAAIDFEHILGAGIDPEKCIKEMIPDGGKYVNVLHVGWPTPIEPAHIPIPLGSEQQEWLYKWMLALRKKGFDESENRYIIFERGGPTPFPGTGGSDPVQQSTLALKKIIKFLRQEVPVDKLPPEFYGIEESTIKMQEAEVMEHAMDPIKGLLHIPEEKHTFLGKAAVEKGKAKEWETEKYR